MAKYQIIGVQDARSRGGEYADAVAVQFPSVFQDAPGEHGVLYRRAADPLVLMDTESTPVSIVTSQRVPDEIQILLHNTASDETAALRTRVETLETQVADLLSR